ncbi:MAG: metallophosphoesterase [Bdellovibrionales bacterium]
MKENFSRQLGVSLCLSLGSVFLFIISCTNIGLSQLNDRVSDNFSGGLAAPADIDPTGTNQFSFVVMGDTHVGSPGGGVIDRIASLAQANGDAFAVVTGDLTHGGLEGEFSQFKAIFDRFSLPWRAAIGNHDIFFGGWSRYRTQIGRSIYSFNADNAHIVMLDTANGVMGQNQLEWLEQDLSRNTRPHVILVSHFSPWNGHFSSIYRMSSEEEAAIVKDIAYRHGVDLYFAGHYHGHAEGDLGNTKYIVTGGANDQMDLGQRQNFIRVRVNGDSISAESNFF